MASVAQQLGQLPYTPDAVYDLCVRHNGDVRSQRTGVNVEYVQPFRHADIVDQEETIGSQLLALKHRAGLSLDAIAKGGGYAGRSSVQRYFSSDFSGPLPPDAAVALARALAGKGEPSIKADDVLKLSISEALRAASGEPQRYFLTVEGTVEAGVWREQSEWPESERYDIEVGPPPFKDAKRMAVKMTGHSMDLTIPPGSDLEVLWIKFTNITPVPGDLVIVERHRHDLVELTCKRLDVEGSEYVLRAESSRPEFQEVIRVGSASLDLVTDDGVQIVGIVLSSQQRHSTRRFT
ncbi:S24 family peptidase [Sphingobium sp. MI1205]|uniref:LexA family protein n=1 Tax=Sphingobium sp. MI1205 TaxID=407020 RepID=UPI000782060E